MNINPPSGFVAIPTTAPPANSRTDRPGQQYQHRVFSGEHEWRRRRFRALHIRQFEWNHFGLGQGRDGFCPGDGTTGTVYTGLAINGAQTRLYAANTSLGRIDVYGCSFNPVSLGSGTFVDPSLPTGLVPFNVQDIGGDVYVVYAPAERPAEISAPLGAGPWRSSMKTAASSRS